MTDLKWLQGIDKETKDLDRLVMRHVPVAWYGVASDVKLLGDFDSWTRGFSLSPVEIQDQTFTKFSAVISLLPVSCEASALALKPYILLNVCIWEQSGQNHPISLSRHRMSA